MRRIALAIAISTLFATRVAAANDVIADQLAHPADPRPARYAAGRDRHQRGEGQRCDVHQPAEGRRRRHVCQPVEGFGDDHRAVRAHASAAF